MSRKQGKSVKNAYKNSDIQLTCRKYESKIALTSFAVCKK